MFPHVRNRGFSEIPAHYPIVGKAEPARLGSPLHLCRRPTRRKTRRRPADGRIGDMPPNCSRPGTFGCPPRALTVRIGDMPANCIVAPAGTDALVGQVVMEQLDLVADCATRTLGPRPESPDRPLLRL